MERIDIDETRIRPRNNRFELVGLRRYSLLICCAEALLIIALVFAYLFLLKSTSKQLSITSNQLNFPGQVTDFELNKIAVFETYTDGVNSTKILPGLIPNCDTRKHDLKFGVKCESKSAKECKLSGRVDVDNLDKDPSFLLSGLEGGEQPARATIITTSKSGLRFNTKRGSLLKQINCASSKDECRFKTKLHVDLGALKQEIIGWGGALTDSSAGNILSLSTDGIEKLLDEYFSPDGLSFNMIRISIGGSDFSTRFYTNDDINTTVTKQDFNLEQFSLRSEDVLFKIPVLQLIQRQYKSNRDLKLLASMWSPPVWMKTNEHYNKGYLKGSVSLGAPGHPEEERYYESLAKLKKEFLLAYQAQSIRFWGLTVMNEPVFARQPFLTFNTMIFPPSDYTAYVAKYLGPMLKQDTRLKDIKLLIHDDNRRYLKMFTTELLQTPNASQYIDGVSVHGYVDEDYPTMDEAVEIGKAIHPLADKRRDFFILPTELCSGHLPFMEKALIGNWHRGVHYALDIIRSLQHSAAGWVDWNMALDMEGGPGWLGGRLDSPIIVDKNADAYFKSPMFYVLGHFSRYIPPGSIRVKTEIFNDHFDYQFETVTFKLPQGNFLVTVILNHNPYEVNLNIKVINKQSARNENLYHQVICKADSITTLIYPT